MLDTYRELSCEGISSRNNDIILNMCVKWIEARSSFQCSKLFWYSSGFFKTKIGVVTEKMFLQSKSKFSPIETFISITVVEMSWWKSVSSPSRTTNVVTSR